jgi:hypothetical protein
MADPINVTTCHCKFCQRATGSAYMVEPIFRFADFRVTKGSLKTYEHKSEGSGKVISIHFCGVCGTKLFLSFERFSERYGVFAGTFDDPNWFVIDTDNSKHIFVDVARHETILPAGIAVFGEHAQLNDGTPLDPVVLAQPSMIGIIRDRPASA